MGRGGTDGGREMSPLFLAESLVPEMGRLFQMALAARKPENGAKIASVFTRRGYVYCKTQQGGVNIRLQDEAHLQRLTRGVPMQRADRVVPDALGANSQLARTVPALEWRPRVEELGSGVGAGSGGANERRPASTELGRVPATLPASIQSTGLPDGASGSTGAELADPLGAVPPGLVPGGSRPPDSGAAGGAEGGAEGGADGRPAGHTAG